MGYPKNGYPDQQYLKWLPEQPFYNIHGGKNGFIASFIAPDGRFFQLLKADKHFFGLCYGDDNLIIRTASGPNARSWRYPRTVYATAQYPLMWARQLRRVINDPNIHVRGVDVTAGERFDGAGKYAWEQEGYGRGNRLGGKLGKMLLLDD